MKMMKKVLCFLTLVLAFAACKKQPVLDVDRAALNIDAAGSTEQVNVTANYPWKASTTTSWIKVKYTEGESVLTITVSRNNDTDVRQGTVTLTSEELTRTISVTQAQRDAIELDSAGRIVLESDAQSIEIKLRANVELTAKVTEGADWVSVTSTKAMTARTVTLAVKANPDRAMRRAMVTFSDKSGAITQQVMIDQNGKAQVVKIDFSGIAQFKVPLLLPPSGAVLSANVFWNGSSKAETYDKTMVHDFDPNGSGSVRIEAHNALFLEFTDVKGLDKIDLSDF